MGEQELREEIKQLKARIAELEQRTVGEIRLGPQPQQAKAESARLTKELIDAATKALHEHETDHEGRQICTTSGEAPSKVRAEQVEKTGQHKSYVVLCEEERAKGFVRPYRDRYKHGKCGAVTTMGRSLSETYARDPSFYGATFCCSCNAHFPVAEFTWTADDQQVGS